jgi:hypothetical protein
VRRKRNLDPKVDQTAKQQLYDASVDNMPFLRPCELIETKHSVPTVKVGNYRQIPFSHWDFSETKLRILKGSYLACSESVDFILLYRLYEKHSIVKNEREGIRAIQNAFRSGFFEKFEFWRKCK